MQTRGIDHSKGGGITCAAWQRESVEDSRAQQVNGERVFAWASSLLAASENVTVEQAIRLAVKIVAALDGYQPEETDEEVEVD
jgi:hypothetical protein